METEKIIFLRNFLFRTFLISVLFAILFFAITMIFWNTWTEWLEISFMMEEKELGELMLNFFINVRLVLVFFMLAPTLALHWMAMNRK